MSSPAQAAEATAREVPIPKTNRALVLTSFTSPPTLTTLPLPADSYPAKTGTVLLKVLSTLVIPYASLVHSGALSAANLPGPLPLIPNANGIARVVSAPPDALYLRPGQLAYVDCTIRARDDPIPQNPIHIAGHFGGVPGDPLVERFVGGGGPDGPGWHARSGTLQEYVSLPLENVYPLDEELLLSSDSGYTPERLASLTCYTIAAGGMMEAGKVKVGETVVVGPSGGSISGAAVEIALALGAGTVIILGRDEGKLGEMKRRLLLSLQSPAGAGGSSRRRPGQKVEYVVMSGDEEADAESIKAKTPRGEGADLYNDWTPGAAERPPYLAAAVRAMKKRGRVVLSGSPSGKLELPYAYVVGRDLQLTGKNMFSRQATYDLIRLVEQGRLDVGSDKSGAGVDVKVFGLEEHQAAIKHAEGGGWRNYTVVSPNKE
ncbi:hypothetical protein QBC42DRAFT_344595 [Cladorrhinum samala]|uniref:Alcohol dehydrogenase-like C-terminal domain-containing protein n=1 Tax=Cladorrhinum samala TaxID=585594 RepID=A0AAV9HUK1_9PEZI|nr:hypothetical protein QBC42DRAFT_344595 [Cladorrhinum samala]